MSGTIKYFLNESRDFILRNDNIRNNSSPLPSVSGVSRHEAQYSRVEVSRVTVFHLHWIPGSGAELQKTLGIRKSSKDVNPPPGYIVNGNYTSSSKKPLCFYKILSEF